MSNSAASSLSVDIPTTNTTSAHYVTPPSSFIGPPTPPATEERFPQVKRILAHFKDIQSGRPRLCRKQRWIQFWFADGKFDKIVRRLKGDTDLNGYVKDKVRYNYDYQTRQFAIRMLSDIHEAFREALHQEIWNSVISCQKQRRSLKDWKKGGLRTKRTSAGKRKLPLAETPERPVTAEDEEEWGLEEARAAKRANRGDCAFSGTRRLTAGLTWRRSARLGDASQPHSV
ncbi:hypothetical protein PMIN01_13566 [Paraphaeosphaeria minitans]|uniref:Uncharacterized protein n=1 Tax=Paraphaeosphaeria minitans TaxID=565426 RepID=A0A9P6G4A3_9PLEO|nr:hypothetical protein PMIN01_13566 [Paraphaeosphaeria minitans]